jgi:choline monooxygenase
VTGRAVAEHRELLESLDAGFALPSSWYTDEALFARERERVLLRGWHYAAHTGQLRRAGDRVTIDVAGVPVVVLRDAADDIRGLVNVCRHHAHPVVLEAGNGAALECPYDGWSYNLDGALRHVPDRDPGLDVAGLDLIPVQTAVWGPAIWVNVDRTAPPFSEWTAGMAELVASHGLDVDAHALAFEDTWTISANWKVFLDNAIECYHCPTCHPALSEVLEMDPALHRLHVGGRYWIWHKVPLKEGALGDAVAPDGEDGDDRVYYYFHWIFPTTYFQYVHYPGTGFDIGTIGVRSVDEIVFRHLTFLPAGTSEAELAARWQRIENDPTISEDVAICERVQRAHAADFAPPGRLLPGSEWLLQHFQRVVVELMAAPR